MGPLGGQLTATAPIASEQPALSVNMGPATTNLSTAAKVAIAVPAGIAGTAAVGALAYSWVAGESFGAVVRGAWSGIRNFAETFGRRY